MAADFNSLQTFLPEGCELVQRVFRLDGSQPCLALGVLRPFALTPTKGAQAPEIPGAWQAAAQALGADGQLDEGFPKIRAELLAAASCHAPPGYLQSPISARIRAGELDLQLAIEQDGAPVSAFAPLLPNDAARSKYVGALDENWLQSNWPHLPATTDPLFYQCARPAQWLQGFWQGGEEIHACNLHPEFPDLYATLPRLRPRFFVHQTFGADDLRFLELKVNLDTLWLLPGALTGIAIYRALIAINQPQARDVNAFFARLEDQDSEPADATLYMNDCLLAMNPQLAEDVQDRQELEQSLRDLSSPQLLAKIAEQRAQFEKMLRDNGLDDAALMDTLLANPHTRAVAQTIAANGGNVSNFFAGMESLVKEFEQDFQISQQENDLAAAMVKMPDTAAYAPDAPKAAATDLPDPNRANLGRELVQKRLERGLGCQGLDLSGANLAGMNLAGVDFSAAILSGANLAAAQLQGSNLAGAILHDARLDAARLEGCNLRDASLDGASLAAASLRGACMQESSCTEVNFTGVDLSGVDLQGASLVRAWLAHCQAEHLQASGADFSHANLQACNLRHAILEHADFSGALLARASLDQASCQNANFTMADLSAVCAVGADLRSSQSTAASLWIGANLTNALLDGASWVGATLDKIQLNKTQASDADFSQCSLLQASICASTLKEAKFDLAQLKQCDIRATNLMQASFGQAAIINCNIFDCNLYGASFNDAELAGTSFDECNIQATILAHKGVQA